MNRKQRRANKVKLRLHKDGSAMRVVEFRCPRCSRRLLTSELEATPPQPGMVPYCQDCLKGGNPVVMDRKVYRSGPPDLIV